MPIANTEPGAAGYDEIDESEGLTLWEAVKAGEALERAFDTMRRSGSRSEDAPAPVADLDAFRFKASFGGVDSDPAASDHRKVN